MIAEVFTLIADLNKRQTKAAATIISGHIEPVAQTAPAATKTDRFDAISLREHSQTDDILTSSFR